MEQFIHHLWKFRLYQASELLTTTGIPFTVIDVGVPNTNAGPDFFNAKIRIEDKVWAGNIEIHTSSSDWYRHEHHKNDAYNSVIMHVVVNNDCDIVMTNNHRIIPQTVLKIPDAIRENYEYLLYADKGVACIDRISEILPVYLTDWKNALTIERLESKAQQIYQTLKQKEDSWEEALYITLSRNLGFGINGDAFERLAKSLPLRYIQKHQDSLLQIEAMLFGQAGLLQEEGVTDPYFMELQKEYYFLQNKFDLLPLEPFIFKKLRIRPQNFPHIKIAQLAAILYYNEHLFSKVIDIKKEVNEYFPYFLPSVSEYWLCHYHFSTSSSRSDKKLGLSALHIILINTVAPILYAYGKRKKQSHLVDYSLYLLENIPPEKNSIISLFKGASLGACHAADSQALIQLKREYCEKKKCLFCRIGHKLLAKPEDNQKKIM